MGKKIFGGLKRVVWHKNNKASKRMDFSKDKQSSFQFLENKDIGMVKKNFLSE